MTSQPAEHEAPQGDARSMEPPYRLGEMLIREGVVTSDDVQQALTLQANGAEWRLGRILVRLGALDDYTLTRTLAKQFHTEVVDLRRTPPAASVLARLPREAALQLQALPVSLDADVLTIAVADPPTRELRTALQRSADARVRLVMCPADELTAALEYWYADEHDDEYEMIVDQDDEAGDAASDAGASPHVQHSDPGGDRDRACEDQVIAWLLREADRRGATATHLDHSDAGLSVRYRIGADLVPGPQLPTATGTAVCERLTTAAELDQSPATVVEGQFDVMLVGRLLTCRVATVRTSTGVHIVVRTRAKNRSDHLAAVGIHRIAARDLRRLLGIGRGVLVVGGTDRGARESVCRALIGEIGTAERVAVVLYTDSELEIPGAIEIKLESTTLAGIHSAMMLSADAIVVDGVTGVESSRDALDASSHMLVILTVVEEDPVQVASRLVEEVGAFLVAGTMRAVLIATAQDTGVSTSVHVVTDDVCQTILDLDGPH